MKLTVIIPTYRRPGDLARCLSGLADQERKPDDVIVVLREDDDASVVAVSQWSQLLPLRTYSITVPGVVQALNLGLSHANGEIITITDDDTHATKDWLALIEGHFERDPRLGGLGGRDLIHVDGKILPATNDQVGLILPFGKLIGNHHSGRGPAQEVDHLKGVNMSWRMGAIAGLSFDSNLRGSGAQVYFELAFSLEVQRRGWRIVYDPAVQVHHYLARRFDNDDRAEPDLQALENAAFNLYLVLRRYMRQGMRRHLALFWVHYIGGFGHPGMLRGLWFRVKRNARGIALRGATARAWERAKKESAGGQSQGTSGSITTE